MVFASRNILAVVYSSLLLGSIVSPYLYIAGGALTYFHAAAIVILIPWLAVSTLVLLLIFIKRSRLEDKLSDVLGAYRRPAAGAVAIAAMGSSYFIESKIARFTLLLPVEYWYYLTVVTGISTAGAFAVIVFTRPSRLERYIASRLSSGVSRAAGYVALVIGLVFACTRVYAYYLYKRPPSP